LVIGVDNNPYMLTLAGIRFGHMRLASDVHYLYAMNIKSDPYSLRVEPEMQPDYELTRDKINLIVDDIRELTALKHYLNGDKVDLVTSVFCVAGAMGKYQEGFWQEDLAQITQRLSPESIRRMKQVNTATRNAVFAQAPQLLKPGGHLAYIDRVHPDSTDLRLSLDIPSEMQLLEARTQMFEQPDVEGLTEMVSHTGVKTDKVKFVFYRFQYQP